MYEEQKHAAYLAALATWDSDAFNDLDAPPGPSVEETMLAVAKVFG